ncbi:hypothetical protein [Agromyces laixinhei]|uniref:hypothetical protein n=1 Tax=Agromyces laixinhei TaxID=2585717 RepID=UPI0011162974|nr:hypothetical protein [Agromyces laixinhei]
MNTKKATPVIATVSLVVLLSGCAGAAGFAGAAHGGQVRDDLSPAANAAIGLARGHVIVRDDLSPTRGVKSTATVDVVDDLSPLRSGASVPRSSQPDIVVDDRSPLRGSR